MEQIKFDIFISYSRADLDRVKEIVAEIEDSTGAACWMDLDGIESGEQFENVIISAINGSDIFLFMLSDNSMRSEWTLDEIDFAKSKKKRIVIVSIETVSMSDIFYFRYHKYDQIKWDDIPQRKKLLRDVRNWKGQVNDNMMEKTNGNNIHSFVVHDDKISLIIGGGFSFTMVKDDENDVFIGNIPVEEILDYVKKHDYQKTKDSELSIIDAFVLLPFFSLFIRYVIKKYKTNKKRKEKAFDLILSEVNKKYNIQLVKVSEELRNKTNLVLTDYAVALYLSKKEGAKRTLLEKLNEINKS